MALFAGAAGSINCGNEAAAPTAEETIYAPGQESSNPGDFNLVPSPGSTLGTVPLGNLGGGVAPHADAIGPIVGDRRVPFSPANDEQFIDFFVGHHSDAIEMAKLVIDHGSSDIVRSLAFRMARAQVMEVEQMRSARQELTGQADSPAPPLDAHMKADMEAMMEMRGEALDQAFLAHMIAHHAAGLAPAMRAAERLTRRDMIALAEQITSHQADEIGTMIALLGKDLHEQAAGADPSLVGDRRVPLTPGGNVVFIDFFADHHIKALEMASLASHKAASQRVRDLAARMLEEQQQELTLMRSIRLETVGSAFTPPSSDPHMEAHLRSLALLSGEQFDRMFLAEMIAHHAAGLAPAMRAVPHLRRLDLRELAEEIFRMQAWQIDEMKAMLGRSRE